MSYFTPNMEIEVSYFLFPGGCPPSLTTVHALDLDRRCCQEYALCRSEWIIGLARCGLGIQGRRQTRRSGVYCCPQQGQVTHLFMNII